ncbi:MFS transporter [Arthrobacter sp. ERGS1:01]|uniref:MFS transporter n=1 Tax=Arthrobacter sp. ERGS1:01 TaxID=1704044 RepID=UPI0006B64945|nr:MFS transporter [Arthrobacter sp. ERGS1:01]
MSHSPAQVQAPRPAEETPLLSGKRAASLVAVLVVAVLSYQLNATMISPALPDIAKSLGVSSAAASQVSSLFFLAGAILGIALGRWSDFIGRRRVLLIVLTVLAVGTLLCMFAPNLGFLLVGRVLQGSSSAAFQLAYIVLSETLPAKLFGTTLGIITAVNGGVGGVDGYIGGLLTEHFGFRSIFVVVFAVGLIGLAGVALVVPKGKPASTTGKMDWAGAATLSIALICLTYFVSQGSESGWLAPVTLLFALGAVVAFLVFVWVEKHNATPLIALHHLRSRQVWPVLATTVLTLTGVFAVINFTVVLLSQGDKPGFGMSASTSALLFLMPAALIGVGAAPLAGWLAGKHGWLRILRTGLVLSILALAAVVVFAFNIWAVAALIAFLGFAYNGLVLTTVNGLGVLLSPRDAPAALPGLNGASFGIGASLGIGIVAPFVSLGTSEGYVTALWISGAITLLALITSMFIAPREGQSI